jgi:hypothetical protein
MNISTEIHGYSDPVHFAISAVPTQLYRRSLGNLDNRGMGGKMAKCANLPTLSMGHTFPLLTLTDFAMEAILSIFYPFIDQLTSR